jgi:hypothetical protein
MVITFRHLKNMLLGRTKVTMQYPEEKVGFAHAGSLSRRAHARPRRRRPDPLRGLPALRVHLPAACDQDHTG